MRRQHRVQEMAQAAAICFLAIMTLWLGSGCAPQVYSKVSHKDFSLSPELLKENGIAFITPSTVTGQEEEKQAVAFVFADTLKRERPDLQVVTLPETLSAINRAGLADAYHQMYRDYRDTGIFKRDILKKIADQTATRYLCQLKLAGFRQGSSGRFGVFGLRLVETKYAALRLFFQIWDAETGEIVWEAVDEMNWSEDSLIEKTISLQTVIEDAAKKIVSDLPGNVDEG